MSASTSPIIQRSPRARLDALEIIALFGLLIASVALLRGNFDHTNYRGDGTFKNNTGGRYGSGSAFRYEVSFGQVDLSTSKSSTFTFTGLPDQEFIIGMQVSPGRDRLPTDYLRSPIVRVLLQREGVVVLDQTAPLKDWLWERSGRVEDGVGPAFLYRTGKNKEIPLGDKRGTIRIERTGESADHGWGTNFQPSATATYRLTFEVITGDPVAKKFSIELVMRNT